MRIISFSIVMLIAIAAPATAETFSGPATAVDGDTMEVQGERIRLEGIDAPELDQTCLRNGKEIACGVIARAALLDLITGVDVVCEVRGEAVGGVMPAYCTADGFNIGGNMVYTGWALPAPDWTAYDAIRDGAVEDRRGLWATEFTEPWVWRESAP